MSNEQTSGVRVASSALLGEPTPFEIVQSAIDTANAYASGPHVNLRIVTLRMDDALRVLDALRPNVCARCDGTGAIWLIDGSDECPDCLGSGKPPNTHGQAKNRPDTNPND